MNSRTAAVILDHDVRRPYSRLPGGETMRSTTLLQHEMHVGDAAALFEEAEQQRRHVVGQIADEANTRIAGDGAEVGFGAVMWQAPRSSSRCSRNQVAIELDGIDAGAGGEQRQVMAPWLDRSDQRSPDCGAMTETIRAMMLDG